MLRNRSRTVTTKQSLMTDHNSVPSPKPNQTTPKIGSPRFLNNFFPKGITNFETVISRPTSKLDSPRISIFGSLFGYHDQNMAQSPRALTEKKQFSDNKGIGLALIDSIKDEKSPENLSLTKQSSCRRVHFASKLKIQIPTLVQSASSPIHSPQSPDLGINTPNSQFSEVQAMETPNMSTRGLSWSEMELSEDYTCVISHGPNPKTTRIFDNCIVESCCGVVALSDLKNKYNLRSPSQSFLSICHTCKKNLGEGKDIYMYRGEQAFCSNECRCEEMLLDGFKNSEN